MSFYYRYLVDEAEFGVRLMESHMLSGVETEGSIQWYSNHVIMNSDKLAEFYEYDSAFGRITKFTYHEPKVDYTEDELEEIEDHPLPNGEVLYSRVMKYDFYNYFFMEEPTIVVPEGYMAEPENPVEK